MLDFVRPRIDRGLAVVEVGRGERNEPRAGPDYAATLAPTYFNYRKTSIYAGSNEIQHNIMAKMVLGL